MERRNGLSRQSSKLWRALRNGDFEEEDVWAVLNETAAPTHDFNLADSKPTDELTRSARPSAPLPIPRKASEVDGGGDGVTDDDSDGGEEVSEKAPPHEVIAKRMAKSQISSFSVFEGVGRTLKGRDLSKVRNAVLTKTGFLESL